MDHITITDADLGIVEGRHDLALTPIEEACRDYLIEVATGRGCALPASELAAWVFGDSGEQAKRNLRYLVNHLIASHKVPIGSLGGHGGGYWIISSQEEEELVYQARKRRLITGAIKMTHGRKNAYVDVIEQMTLFIDEPEGEQEIERLKLAPDKDPMPAWLKIVTRHLDRISCDPQKYAVEIEALQRRFAPIFIPRDRMLQIKRTAEQLQGLLQDVA